MGSHCAASLALSHTCVSHKAFRTNVEVWHFLAIKFPCVNICSNWFGIYISGEYPVEKCGYGYGHSFSSSLHSSWQHFPWQ